MKDNTSTKKGNSFHLDKGALTMKGGWFEDESDKTKLKGPSVNVGPTRDSPAPHSPVQGPRTA